MIEGETQQAREEKATEYRGGTVYLCDQSNAISDTSTTISPNASTTTKNDDWSITHDNTEGVTRLQNSEPISFGAVSGFVVDQIVIESTETSGNFIVENEPSDDLDLTGDGQVTLESGKLSITIGK